MEKGDISNAAPKLIYINLDLFTNHVETPEKKFLQKAKIKVSRELDLHRASLINHRCFLLSDVSVVCFSTDGTDLKPWEDKLDKLGINPYRFFETFVDPAQLIREVPYMKGLLGIIDLPNRALTWGSKFISYESLVNLT